MLNYQRVYHHISHEIPLNPIKTPLNPIKTPFINVYTNLKNESYTFTTSPVCPDLKPGSFSLRRWSADRDPQPFPCASSKPGPFQWGSEVKSPMKSGPDKSLTWTSLHHPTIGEILFNKYFRKVMFEIPETGHLLTITNPYQIWADPLSYILNIFNLAILSGQSTNGESNVGICSR